MSSTPFPPDDGENDHALEPSTGLLLSDVERLAAQRPEGVAEGLPGAPSPLAPNDGESTHAPEAPTSLRLSDAERIAIKRLDGATAGSPEEALAIAPNDDESRAASPPADRVEAV